MTFVLGPDAWEGFVGSEIEGRYFKPEGAIPSMTDIYSSTNWLIKQNNVGDVPVTLQNHS